jgi:cytochrome c oxidase subunit III
MTTASHATDVSHGHGNGDHPAFLAHHFDTPDQQYASGKLGMWVFLGTELLMFGGLFVAYAVYRANHPEVYEYAHTYLNKWWGAVNTVILLVSSFTMAWAVRCSQLGKNQATVILCVLTLLGGAGFMCIKYVEYKSKWEHHLFPGSANVFHRDFSGNRAETITHLEASHDASAAAGHGADHGGEHGAVDPSHDTTTPHTQGQRATEDRPVITTPTGRPTNAGGQGQASDTVDGGGSSMRGDIAGDNASEAAQIGHPAAQPAGERPGSDEFRGQAGASEHGAAAPLPPVRVLYADPNANTADAAKIVPTFVQPQSLAVSMVPAGGHLKFAELEGRDKIRINTFFSVYFLMTGLHGVHVLVGMGLIAWVAVKAMGGIFGPAYYTPVDLVGLYWHLVDLIWIFLFPLLYLIH